MKTVVCFSGQARSLEYTHKNIKENLLSYLGDCDIITHTPEDSDAHKVEKYLKKNNLIVIEPDIFIPPRTIVFDQNCRGEIQTYLQMLNSRRRVGEVLALTEEKYDRVIHARLDVKYFKPLENVLDGLDLQELYVPDFHSFSIVQGNGYNDRFAVSNYDNMLKYFNLFYYVFEEAKMGIKNHGESTLYRYLDFCKIPVKKIPVRFTRVRPNGDEIDGRLNSDPSTWKSVERF